MSSDRLRRCVGIGAGGHAKVVLEALRLSQVMEVAGLLDPARFAAGVRDVLGAPVLGGDELLPSLRESGVSCAFVGVGSIGATTARERVYARLILLGFDVLVIVHPSAYVSPSAHLGAGSVVLPQAMVHSSAHVDLNVIVNSGAIIEHDCRLGAHSHIGCGAVLSGGVTIGERAHIGAGASIRQGIVIGTGATVGVGAAVVADVAPHTVVIGNPARPYVRRS